MLIVKERSWRDCGYFFFFKGGGGCTPIKSIHLWTKWEKRSACLAIRLKWRWRIPLTLSYLLQFNVNGSWMNEKWDIITALEVAGVFGSEFKKTWRPGVPTSGLLASASAVNYHLGRWPKLRWYRSTSLRLLNNYLTPAQVNYCLRVFRLIIIHLCHSNEFQVFHPNCYTGLNFNLSFKNPVMKFKNQTKN